MQAKRHYQPFLVKDHIGPGTSHLIYHFENGYGASVIPEYELGSYPRLQVIPGKLELGILRLDPDTDPHLDSNWGLCYDSPICSDDAVLRYLTQAEVDQLLDQIAGL